MKKSTTGSQCKPTRNKHRMVTRLIDHLLTDHRSLHQWLLWPDYSYLLLTDTLNRIQLVTKY